MVIKFAWGITGAGDFLMESVEVIKGIMRDFNCKLMVFISKAGVKVLKWYKLMKDVEVLTAKINVEVDANTPFILGRLQTGVYQFIVIMPATANTVAKLAHGIADTLITNSVAQAMKTDVPIYIYPVDQKPGTVTTVLPKGKTLDLKTRQIDLDNVARLRSMKGMKVLNHPSELRKIIEQYSKPSQNEEN